MPRRHSLRALPITGAALMGFALTLAVWLAAGYFLTHRVQNARTRAAVVSNRYMDAQQVLSTVNTQILLGSVYMRDALMDPGAATGDFHATVENTFQVIDRLVDQYVPVLDSIEERQRIDRLSSEIEEFKRRMLGVLDKAGAGSAQEARFLLRTQVVPKRDDVIRMSEELRALNREAFVRLQSEVTEIYAGSQRWFWTILSLAIIASFGIALTAVRYAGGLENRLQRQAVAVAANAVELQRLSAKLITTQEEERRTLARDLHDEVGQRLTAIKVELALAERAMEAAGLDPGLLSGARSIADGTLGTVRNLSHLLRPPMLDDLGLAEALQSHVEKFARRHRIAVDLACGGLGARLPAEIETSVYRIVQEALTNVGKHARASRCRVEVAYRTGLVTITVEDDGVGFDEARMAPNDSGLGLVGMRERALQWHGTFDIRRAGARGTRLRVELPVAPIAAPDAPDASFTPLAQAHE